MEPTKSRAGATDARRVRKHNERAILAELRRMGVASKPEIAREISLTPQAVNGIFDALQGAGLVKEGGRRTGTVGHPSTLYSISPTGAYAVGVDIGPKRLEVALVDFCGQLVYRAQTEYLRADPTTVRGAVSTAMNAIWRYVDDADVGRDRVVGLGVVTPPFMLPKSLRSSMRVEGAEEWATSMIEDIVPIDDGLTVDYETEAVVGALAMQMQPEDRLPDSFLFLSLGEALSSCLVLDGDVRRGEHSSAGALALCPVRLGEETIFLGEIASIGALRARLAAAGIDDVEDLYRASHAVPEVVDDWIAMTGRALGHALLTIQAVVDLGSIVVSSGPPASIADAVLDALRAQFASHSQPGLRLPDIRRIRASVGSQAIAAGALALHRHFSPKAGLLTEMLESSSPLHRFLSRSQP